MKKKLIKFRRTKKPQGKKLASPKKQSRKRVAKPKKEISAFGLHALKAPRGARTARRVLGRGSSSGHGKTSTRGSKGQTSRTGRDFYLGFEGGQSPLIRKIPKRGFTSQFKKTYQIVNLRDFARLKEPSVNPQLLQDKGFIKDARLPVKILGDGEIKNSVSISAHAFSRKAVEKITAAGGKIEIINA